MNVQNAFERGLQDNSNVFPVPLFRSELAALTREILRINHANTTTRK